jgi:protein-disulfide isomerase
MKQVVLLLIVTLLVSACSNKESIKEMLKEDPTILTEAIEANPAAFIESLNKAVKLAQGDMQKKKQEEEKRKIEEAFSSPLKPEIRSDELIRGKKGAPLLLVEYSDFQCPFCSRALGTVLSLLKKYDGKIQFVYKHLPLSFHPQAMIASQYYEAIRMQSEDKAIKFHDQVYKDQRKLKNGESFLKGIAKGLKVNMKKLAKDIKSSAVKNRIQSDMDEARKFGIQGTPGFVLNGVPIKGAYPLEHFEDIIKKLQEKDLVKL